MSGKNRFKRVVVEPSAEQATWYATEMVKKIICDAVNEHGICRVALAGGTTPHGLYLMLAGAAVSGEVPWRNVEVFFGDERDVPQDHAESNYRMAQRTLLDHVPIEPGSVHPMPADAENLEQAAAEYESTVRRLVPPDQDGTPRFDLILLGMGADGHTASLFPETDALNEQQKLIVAYYVPILGRHRMTFTYPLLNAARNVVLLVTGEDKADAVESLVGEEGPDVAKSPAAGLKLKDGNLSLVLDSPAAKQSDLPTGESL